MPVRKSMILYCPCASVVTLRTFSIRAGLDASTVTPGSTAPDVSFTTPAIPLCASEAAGTSARNASTRATVMSGHPRWPRPHTFDSRAVLVRLAMSIAITIPSSLSIFPLLTFHLWLDAEPLYTHGGAVRRVFSERPLKSRPVGHQTPYKTVDSSRYLDVK